MPFYVECHAIVASLQLILSGLICVNCNWKYNFALESAGVDFPKTCVGFLCRFSATQNPTTIRVEGDVKLELMREGKKCCMKFLDADVKRPLASVSAREHGRRGVFVVQLNAVT